MITPAASGWYLAAALALVPASRLAARSPRPWMRAAVVAAISAAFLCVFVPRPAVQLEILGYAAVVGLAGYVIRRLTSAAARTAGFAVLAVAIVGFLAASKYLPEPERGSAFVLALPGLSYVTFRAIDHLLQCRAARGAPPGAATTLAYLTFCPTFVSGPIDRADRFQREIESPPEPLTFEAGAAAVRRMALGVVKSLLVADVCRSFSVLDPAAAAAIGSPWELALALVLYLAYIYADFSGYCDLAIGAAALAGFRIPENFDRPYLSSSPQDFWNRWHRTLSWWCRDRIFFPLLAALTRRLRGAPPLLLSCSCVFVTFALIGAWHGDALHWLVYGCLHGAALAAHQCWRAAVGRAAPDLQDRLDASRAWRAVSVVMTLGFVSGALLLTLPFDTAGGLLSAAFGGGAAR